MSTKKSKFQRIWFRPSTMDEARAARARVQDQGERLGLVLPALIGHRERNHFAERIVLAYQEDRR